MRNANIKNSLVSACIFDGNNVANGAGWCDLNINGDTIAVSACTFAGGGAAGAGVAIAAGATNPTLDGINLTNSTAASRVVNASATATFRGIAGWKVKNSGVQTVPIGTSVAITHGLGLTPTRESIRLVPYSNSPTAWVSAVAPTTFTVTLASAAAGAFSLGWFIDMEK